MCETRSAAMMAQLAAWLRAWIWVDDCPVDNAPTAVIRNGQATTIALIEPATWQERVTLLAKASELRQDRGGTPTDTHTFLGRPGTQASWSCHVFVTRCLPDKAAEQPGAMTIADQTSVPVREFGWVTTREHSHLPPTMLIGDWQLNLVSLPSQARENGPRIRLGAIAGPFAQPSPTGPVGTTANQNAVANPFEVQGFMDHDASGIERPEASSS
jgi:hypothetical protein